MKSKLKRGIVITVLTLVGICLIYAVYIAFFTDVKSNSEYMDILDNSFDGKYTITQTDRRLDTYNLPVIKIPIPCFERTYEISYTDHKGKNRSFSFKCTPFHSYWNLTDLENDIDSEIDSILFEDFADEILDKYFDGELNHYNNNPIYDYYEGDGYKINVDFGEYKKVYAPGSILPALCDLDLETFAADADDVTNIDVYLYIDKKLDNEKDGYVDKIKQAVADYNSLSNRKPYYDLDVFLVDDIGSLNGDEAFYSIKCLNGSVVWEEVNGVEVSK